MHLSEEFGCTEKQRNEQFRKHLFLALVIFSFATFFIFYISALKMFSHKKYPLPVTFTSRSGYLVDTSGCQMPELDPFAQEIKRLYKKKVGAFPCPGLKSFIKVEPNATLRINRYVLYKNHKLRPRAANCSFVPILRNETNDRYKIGRRMALKFNTPLKYDAVQVICHKHLEKYHEEYLPLVPFKEEVEIRCNSKRKTIGSSKSVRPLNVIIIGIDSVSKLNMRRHLPRTLSFLKRKLRAMELRGYNKVGDNTFQNLLALLAGIRLTPEYKALFNKMKFDNVSLIWKQFSERLGYRTLMIEDNPNLAMFNYKYEGFLDPPADYYFRPFALAVEKLHSRNKSNGNCLGSKTETSVVYDHVIDFVKTMGDRPYFAFSFLSRLTHDYLNLAGYADVPVLKILKELLRLGATNNSLIIVLSDHGVRYGAIRKTYVGRFEEHWPIMFLSFPSWFYQKHPDCYSNLVLNQNRLTTPFDVHATLKDLIKLRDYREPRVRDINQRGISLFEEIPEARTCNDAGIGEHFCTCGQMTPVDSNSSHVRSAALRLVDSVNFWLEGQQTKCVFLRLDHVLHSHIAQSSRSATDLLGKSGHLDYLVAAVVSPSGAEFEATLRWTRRNSSFAVLGDISRINAYHQQSDCIEDPWLKKFCFCKTRLKGNV